MKEKGKLHNTNNNIAPSYFISNPPCRTDNLLCPHLYNRFASNSPSWPCFVFSVLMSANTTSAVRFSFFSRCSSAPSGQLLCLFLEVTLRVWKSSQSNPCKTSSFWEPQSSPELCFPAQCEHNREVCDRDVFCASHQYPDQADGTFTLLDVEHKIAT